MTATAPRTVTRIIAEPSLSDLANAVQIKQDELADAREYARLLAEQLRDRKQALSERMERDQIEAFTDARTGNRVYIDRRTTYEITDQDRVFAALSQRGRLASCTRLDARAVKKEARTEPLEGTAPMVTRALRVRRQKGA